jgi:hypothetical protein
VTAAVNLPQASEFRRADSGLALTGRNGQVTLRQGAGGRDQADGWCGVVRGPGHGAQQAVRGSVRGRHRGLAQGDWGNICEPLHLCYFSDLDTKTGDSVGRKNSSFFYCGAEAFIARLALAEGGFGGNKGGGLILTSIPSARRPRRAPTCCTWRPLRRLMPFSWAAAPR